MPERMNLRHPKEMKAALFIDRDGTLNVEATYLHKPEDVELIPGTPEALARVNARGIPVIVVTNQAGIGRGMYGWKDFRAVTERIAELLASAGAHIDAVYASPHHPKGMGEYAVANHPDRKPNPGMLLRAAQEHGIDLSRSWMVGDKTIDVEAGRNAGCRTVLVRTGYGASEDSSQADLVVDDLVQAIDQILAQWP
jgi:D-glycero-D-manno-heptose 1,7-bisphosphate phosphatase